MKATTMIDEWRKGCGNALPCNPEHCHECTVALIDALDAKSQEYERVLNYYSNGMSDFGTKAKRILGHD